MDTLYDLGQRWALSDKLDGLVPKLARGIGRLLMLHGRGGPGGLSGERTAG
jgi:hypothetical protein